MSVVGGIYIYVVCYFGFGIVVFYLFNLISSMTRGLVLGVVGNLYWINFFVCDNDIIWIKFKNNNL